MVVSKDDGILAVAQGARSRFERLRIPKAELEWAYAAYNPDVNAEIFVREAEKIFPRLNCGLASAYLQTMLGGEVVYGWYGPHPHSFLLLKGSFVVDITADQYGGPEVYYGELALPWRLPP